jgi:tetratricopeptide (TPR) repeat protein
VLASAAHGAPERTPAAAVQAAGPAAGEAPPAGGRPAAVADVEESARALFTALNGTNFFENATAWKRARRAGRLDELIGMFEQAAVASPNDVRAQMALADAYLANVVMGVKRDQLSRKADEQFDKVLSLDDRHWRARFAKAMSYTFWPEIEGKRPEAIAHFETLIRQQEAAPAEAHQAQVYLVLGNLLSSMDMAGARKVWERGAARHPDHDELRRKTQR